MTFRDRHPHSAVRGRSVRAGFTLVELLLVMFVMSVLVALVVGVGRYVIEQGRKQETINNQDRLIGGIDAFHKVVGQYPEDDPNGYGLITILVRQLDGDFSRVKPPGIKTSSALTNEIRDSTKVFVGLGTDDTGVAAAAYTKDAWGNEMVYYNEGGLGGKPVIISAGPDGDFGFGVSKLDKEKRKDNIRSDTRE